MSEFRVEKRRVAADLTLATGDTVSGFFFVGDSTASRSGRERIGDLLNGQQGFFPFERHDGTTALYNRAHLVLVGLPQGIAEAELEPGYVVARRRLVNMVLSTGASLSGSVAVYRPTGRDRLSDYTRSADRFRYVVTPERTIIVNSDQIVELVEIAD